MRALNLPFHVALIATLFTNLSFREAQAQVQNSNSKKAFELSGRGGTIEYPQGWSPRNYANVRELLNVAPEMIPNNPASCDTSLKIIDTTPPS